jgi:hypothetical protein
VDLARSTARGKQTRVATTGILQYCNYCNIAIEFLSCSLLAGSKMASSPLAARMGDGGGMGGGGGSSATSFKKVTAELAERRRLRDEEEQAVLKKEDVERRRASRQLVRARERRASCRCRPQSKAATSAALPSARLRNRACVYVGAASPHCVAWVGTSIMPASFRTNQCLLLPRSPGTREAAAAARGVRGGTGGDEGAEEGGGGTGSPRAGSRAGGGGAQKAGGE